MFQGTICICELVFNRPLRRFDRPKTPGPFCVGNDCSFQRCPCEIRPKGFCNIELTVRNLPEQEIADSHLVCRAYQKVGIGKSACIQMLAHTLLIDVFKAEFALFVFLCDFLGRVHKLCSTALALNNGG